MTTNNQTSPNRFLQANLSLALAIIPSYLFFTCMPSVVALIDNWREGMQLSPRYDVLVGVSIHWWVPALLVLLLMRHTHFEQWLKVNLLAHIGITIANICLLVFLAIYVYYNEHMYVLSGLRDQIMFTAYGFAAVATFFNMLWHYVVLPNPKLRAWLTDDILSEQLK